jgi:hypothetical protein
LGPGAVCLRPFRPALFWRRVRPATLRARSGPAVARPSVPGAGQSPRGSPARPARAWSRLARLWPAAGPLPLRRSTPRCFGSSPRCVCWRGPRLWCPAPTTVAWPHFSTLICWASRRTWLSRRTTSRAGWAAEAAEYPANGNQARGHEQKSDGHDIRCRYLKIQPDVGRPKKLTKLLQHNAKMINSAFRFTQEEWHGKNCHDR